MECRMPSDFDLPTASFQATPRRDSVAIAMPSRIGRYQIIRELGHGGFGIVYLARDEQLLRQVAVKVPYERLTKEEWSRDDWLAEARIVASLSSPAKIIKQQFVENCGAFCERGHRGRTESSCDLDGW